MQLIDLSTEQLPAESEILTQEVELTPGGGPETLRFRGLDGQAFGVTRILPSVFIDSTALQGQEASAVRLGFRPDDGTETWFEEVNAQAVQDLFRYRALQIPAVIERGCELEVDVLANGAAGVSDGTTHRVTVTLVGLSARQLEARRKTLRDAFGSVPERHWIFVGATEVAASTENVAADLLRDPEDLVFKMHAAANADFAVNGAYRIREETEIHFPRTRIDAARGGLLTLPPPFSIDVRQAAPVEVDFTNRQSSAVDFSFLADAVTRETFQAAQSLPDAQQAQTRTTI
jgi:hypothetical protein